MYTKTCQRKQPFMKKLRTCIKCKIGLWFLSSALPPINIYVCTKFNFNPFCTWYGQIKQPLWKIKRLLHFLSLPTIFKTNFISIPFLLNKIWTRQATTMKTWLRGYNSVNIQGRIMVLVHWLSSHSYLSTNQSFFVKLWLGHASIMKK